MFWGAWRVLKVGPGACCIVCGVRPGGVRGWDPRLLLGSKLPAAEGPGLCWLVQGFPH